MSERKVFMPNYVRTSLLVALILLTMNGCSKNSNSSIDELNRIADAKVAFTAHELYIHQELINDKPIGPGTPQPSDHCPTGPGRWFAGSGRSTATSDVFGDLTEVEVYCINRDRAELFGGLATWTDREGDTISMTFGATLLEGFVYPATPNAALAGYAQFMGGTGKWNGLTGVAFFTGKQNGDGTTTVEYRGTVYLPR